MNIQNFKPDEYINQFEVKLESEGATPEEIEAFKLGISCCISSIDGLLEKGVSIKELTTICNMYGKALPCK